MYQVVIDGWDPHSRTVHGEHYNYHLIDKQYVCTSCRNDRNRAGYQFAPWHPGVLKRLPHDLVKLFPAVILRRSAVDKALVLRVEQAAVSPIGIQTLADHMEECHKQRFMTMQRR